MLARSVESVKIKTNIFSGRFVVTRLQLSIIALTLRYLQRRVRDDAERAVRQAAGGDGHRVPHGRGHLDIHPAVVLRGVLPLPLHRQHVLPGRHVPRDLHLLRAQEQ